MSYSLGIWCEYPLLATSRDPSPLKEATSYFARLLSFIKDNDIRRIVFRLQCPEPPRNWGTAAECWAHIVKPFPLYTLDSSKPYTLTWFLSQHALKNVDVWLLPYQDKWSGYSTLKHYQEPGFNPSGGKSQWDHLAVADYMAAVPLVEYFNTILSTKKVTGIVIETENTTLSGSETQRLSTIFSQLTTKTTLKYGATGGPLISEPHASTIPAWRPSTKCSMFFPQWYWVGASEAYINGDNEELLAKMERCIPLRGSFDKMSYVAMFSCESAFFGNGKWTLQHFRGFLDAFHASKYGTSNFMIFQGNFLTDPARWAPGTPAKRNPCRRCCLF